MTTTLTPREKDIAESAEATMRALNRATQAAIIVCRVLFERIEGKPSTISLSDATTQLRDVSARSAKAVEAWNLFVQSLEPAKT